MISRAIHQIWLGDRPFPEQGAAWAAQAREVMPDWDYRLWTDDDLPGLTERLLCPRLVLDDSLPMGIRCDVLRYEIMRLYGGLYLDHDMEVFRPLDEIMERTCLHVGLSFNRLEALSNAIFAAPAQHPFWDLLLRRIDEAVPARPAADPASVLKFTGYIAVHSALLSWLGGNFDALKVVADGCWTAGWPFDHGDVVAWSREAVHPYHFEEMDHGSFRREDFPRAYAAHHWHGEWTRS